MLNYLSFRYELYKLDKISKAMNLEYKSIEKTITKQQSRHKIFLLLQVGLGDVEPLLS